MMNLYWHRLSFTHSHEYIYGSRMSAVKWHSELPWNMHEKKTHFFWSKGEMEVPLELANSFDQQIC